MPHRSSSVAVFFPFAAALAGLVLCVLRFRAADPVGALAFGLGGMLAMILLAIRLPDDQEGA